MVEDSGVMPSIPLTCDVSLGLKCGGRTEEREKVNDAVNLRKIERRSSTLQCRRGTKVIQCQEDRCNKY